MFIVPCASSVFEFDIKKGVMKSCHDGSPLTHHNTPPPSASAKCQVYLSHTRVQRETRILRPTPMTRPIDLSPLSPIAIAIIDRPLSPLFILLVVSHCPRPARAPSAQRRAASCGAPNRTATRQSAAVRLRRVHSQTKRRRRIRRSSHTVQVSRPPCQRTGADTTRSAPSRQPMPEFQGGATAQPLA